MKLEFEIPNEKVGEVWATFAQAKIFPNVRTDVTAYTREGDVQSVKTTATVDFNDAQWGTVRDLIDDLLAPEEPTGSTRVRNIKVKNVQMGDMVEFADGFIGEVNQHVTQGERVIMGAPGTQLWSYRPNDRVRVHPND